MTKDKALKLALAALGINLTLLKKITPYKGQEDFLSDSIAIAQNAITAIKEALEQTQEPVIDKSAAIRIATSLGWTPQRKPLTDEEIADLWSAQIFHITDLKLAKDFVRDIEAAHDIKENT